MTDINIFINKEKEPTDKELENGIGSTYKLWVQLRNHVLKVYPDGIPEWFLPGKKYGWNYRIKDKKRAILYLLPRENYFKVSFVFGQKATDEILESNISQEIKDDLSKAKKYAEGRGIWIAVNKKSKMPDIKKLIAIKLKY